MNSLENKSISRNTLFLIISILLHLIALLLLQLDNEIFFPPTEVMAESSEKRLAFELVQTPENIDEEPAAETNLFSDKNSVATDLQDGDQTESDLPYQAGDLAMKTLTRSFQKSFQKSTLPDTKPQTKMEKKSAGESTFYEDFQARRKLEQKGVVEVSFDQQLSNAKQKGGISFNTYEWEFAPYMLKLKEKVEGHLNPPYAFTHMGMINGNTLLRFKIYPDGSLKDLCIVGSDAHISLDQTSENAIKFSVPFAPLPKNFPEPFLEVTALFSYLIRKH